MRPPTPLPRSRFPTASHTRRARPAGLRRPAALLIAIGCAITGLAARPAAAADPLSGTQLVAMINQSRAAAGVPALLPHAELTAKAEAWADRMAATGCVCHSRLTDGITVAWRRLGENVGRAPDLATMHQAFLASSGHRANLLDRGFQWVGVGVARAGGQVWVAEVFMDGAPPPPWYVWDARGRAVAARPQGGFWTVAGNGRVTAHEGAPHYGSPAFGQDIARDIVAMPDGNGYAILDGFGGVHRYGSARSWLGTLSAGYWPGWDIARALALAPDGRGFAVLDAWGGIHTAGSAPKPRWAPYWRGWDIARSIAYTATGGIYVLDGFGGLWALRGAPRRSSPYFGWDIARDLVVWGGGQGVAVLDGFGGLHRTGSAKVPGPTAYAPIDRFRGVTTQGGTYLLVRNDGWAQRA